MIASNVKLGVIAMFLIPIILLAACNGDKESTGNEAVKENSKDPVELLVFSNFEETALDFDEIFVKPVKEKYPYISLKIATSANGNTIENAIAAGTIPDIIVGSVLQLGRLQVLGLMSDLNPLIRKHQFDLNRIEPEILNYVKQYSDKGEILGIPYTANFTALFYNKDIFDKFGVAYPKDGMTWDETVELAKKMTRSSDGVDYRGLDPEKLTRVASSLGVSFVDPKTEKPMIQAWKPAYELYKQIISIPGNSSEATFKHNKNTFLKDKTVAMVAKTNMLKDLETADKNALNWDLVTYPQHKDHMGTFGVAGARALLITPQAKNKDAAFQVISTVLSDQVQTEMNSLGTMTPLKSVDVQKTFGEKLPYLKGKNIQSIHKLKPSFRKLSNYDDAGERIVTEHSIDLIKDKDINTIIRETEEEISRAIAAEKAK
jgi:multiple sugar transport system substrate-binding protein